MRRETLLLLIVAAMIPTCGRRAPQSSEPASEHPSNVTPNSSPEAAPSEPIVQEQTCEERREDTLTRLEEELRQHRSCLWDVDCVVVEGGEQRCPEFCPRAVSARGVVAAREALAAACSDIEILSCGEVADCQQETTVTSCTNGSCNLRAAPDEPTPTPPTAVPPQNNHRLSEPPPRPPVGDADERARRLFDAIVANDPARASDFFFPREAFLVLKGITDPGRYYDRLFARYLQDIQHLHTNTDDLEGAEFVRFELVRRGGWVGVREEGNRLPYWVSRHSQIHYRVGEEERSLEVRVLITWGERWYITHLSEFH